MNDQKLSNAIRSAQYVEKHVADPEAKVTKQLRNLSLICECFGWEEAKHYLEICMLRRNAVKQSRTSGPKLHLIQKQ